jgi:hypothetical protein
VLLAASQHVTAIEVGFDRASTARSSRSLLRVRDDVAEGIGDLVGDRRLHEVRRVDREERAGREPSDVALHDVNDDAVVLRVAVLAGVLQRTRPARGHMMMTAPAVERGPTGPAELNVGRRPGHRSGLRAAAATAGALTSAAVVVITLVAIPRTDRFFAAHTATSPVAAWADAAAGLSLVGVAVLASVLRPGRRDGRVTAAATAIAWVAPTWVAWVDAGPLARSVAMLVQPLLLAALMYLLLPVSPSIAPRRHRLISASVITLLGGIAVGRALVRDPFLDPYCWGNCQLNVLLVASRPGVARLLDTAWAMSTVPIGAALAGVAAWELTRGTPSARRLLGPVLLPAIAVRAWTVALFAVGSAMLVVRSWRAQQRMGRLVMELEDAPAAGTLGPALARDGRRQSRRPVPVGRWRRIHGRRW